MNDSRAVKGERTFSATEHPRYRVAVFGGRDDGTLQLTFARAHEPGMEAAADAGAAVVLHEDAARWLAGAILDLLPPPGEPPAPANTAERPQWVEAVFGEDIRRDE